LLLASVTAPAFASAGPDDRRALRGQDVQQADDDDDDNKPQRRERPARVEQSDDDGDRRPARELRRAQRNGDGEGDGAPPPPAPIVVQQSDAPPSLRERRTRERFRENTPGAIHEGSRNGARVLRDRIARGDAPMISRVPRAGTQPPPRSGSRLRNSNHHWRGDWRSDRRYDWNSHRRRYSWLFNLGFYRDPFGWGYQPFSIGWRMWPSYYSHSYWLNDPWHYRLPYAPPGYRWIRYYDDAILVDMWDGQVVDVIRDFFW
jgi:hypothetical protein